MGDTAVSYQELIAFAAGELPPEQGDRVRMYIETHPEAAATVARYRALRALLRDETGEMPRPDASARARAIFRPPHDPNRTQSFRDPGKRSITGESLLPLWVSLLLRPRLSRAVLVFIVLLGSSLMTAGSAAAQDALPGEPLYSIKLGMESLRLAVAPSQAVRFELKFTFAERRLMEMKRLIAQERFERLESSLFAYQGTLAMAMRDLPPPRNADCSSPARYRTHAARSLEDFQKMLQVDPVTIPPEFIPLFEQALLESDDHLHALRCGEETASMP
jgi:hypothetical protein